MVYKLTDDQRDLLLVMVEDWNTYIDQNGSDYVIYPGMVDSLVEIYNDGEYTGKFRTRLNLIRKLWLANIYNKGLSCWNELRELNIEK